MINSYANLYTFYVMGLFAIPAIALGLAGRNLRNYGLVASVGMVWLIVSADPGQLWWFLAFMAWQTGLVYGWLAYTRGHPKPHRYLGRAAALAATFPLAMVKLFAIWPTLSFGFIGVSYLSFRIIQIVLETTDGLIEKLPLADYASFVLFFPTFTSGPIDRSRRFLTDSHRTWTRSEYAWLLGRGLCLLVLGAVYNFVFSAWFYDLAGWATGPHAWAYMYVYSGDLFFDFAGYSSMAVGMSYIFGVRTPPNFRMPFAAESIKDFWSRWHITLSFWFRDYLYTRMAMYLMKKKFFADRLTAGRVAMAANMVLMGFWHGFTVHYVLYGAYHGLLLVANDIYEKRCPLYRHRERALYRVIAILVTAQLVIFGFWIFSGNLIQI